MTTTRPKLDPEDRFAILDLIALYGHTLDSGDLDGWIDLFVADAVYTLPTQVLESRDEIRTWIDSLADLRQPDLQTRHHTTNTLLYPLSADRVLGRSMLFMTAQPRGPANQEVIPLHATEDQRARLTLAGLYGDEFVRTPAGWRFQSRQADVDFTLEPRFIELV